jgi:hypothetical protein
MKWKMVAISVIVGLLAALVMPLSASGAEILPSDTIPTQATITGGGSPPIVKAQWELADDDETVPGTQVNIVPSGDKAMCAYIVVTDPNGRGDIAQVHADVYHPDGSFKFQVLATKLDPIADQAEIEQAKADAVAAETGTWTTNVTEMLLDPTLPPVTDEPITQDVADMLDEEIYNTETAYIYRADWLMNYHQPAGIYTVECWATDGSGEQSFRIVSWYEWVATPVLELDFTSIDYGEIVPCVEKTVPGDYTMDPAGPAPPVMPTVKNEGNVPLDIGVHSTAMVGVNQGKEIVDFDAKFKDEKIVYTACTDVWFTSQLGLCETMKINFSIHAPVGTPSDTYVGELHMLASP